MKKIELRITELLLAYNLSINELHLKTGIRRATLSELTNGKRIRIQFDHIEKIANALDIDDINEIITLVEAGNEEKKWQQGIKPNLKNQRR
ncbi:XRE family transcriptional regulator [Pueribacillus theae]|uniref:XRE family transcriptional regulator n=1 Tax=Pueribacillus theae TaxID=2171751 RepID=A0A2U1K6B4_9BACI|nr:helix-turn-helix transcriptional regulator [Pueribacillus theae]PWA13081.1 XRE family transcriptional regulator [Pueribacillus theae]